MMQRDSIGTRDERWIALQSLAEAAPRTLHSARPVRADPLVALPARCGPSRPRYPAPPLRIRRPPAQLLDAPSRTKCGASAGEPRAAGHHRAGALKSPAKLPRNSIIGPLLLHRPILGRFFPSPTAIARLSAGRGGLKVRKGCVDNEESTALFPLLSSGVTEGSPVAARTAVRSRWPDHGTNRPAIDLSVVGDPAAARQLGPQFSARRCPGRMCLRRRASPAAAVPFDRSRRAGAGAARSNRQSRGSAPSCQTQLKTRSNAGESRPAIAADQTLFSLADAIAYALDNSPRLRSASAAILRSSGQEQAAFAAFLPQVDLLTQLARCRRRSRPAYPERKASFSRAARALAPTLRRNSVCS